MSSDYNKVTSITIAKAQACLRSNFAGLWAFERPLIEVPIEIIK